MSEGTTAEVSFAIADEIKVYNRVMYELQKERIAVGNRISQRESAELPITRRVRNLYENITNLEKDAKGVIVETVRTTPIWNAFFKDVKGVAEVLASTLIAEVRDISQFPTVSSLWAYAGLLPGYVVAECDNDPKHKLIMSSDKHKTCPVYVEEEKKEDEEEREHGAYNKTPCGRTITIIERVEGKSPRRTRGYHFLFNTRLKTTAWKIGGQLIKQGDDKYRNIYYTEKKRQAELHKELKPMQIHLRAMRKMVKILLQHMWLKWREVEGLPITKPYVFENMEGHTHYIEP